MAVKVLELLGETNLQELYDLIESLEGATIAGRELQRITSQNSEFYAQYYYLMAKNKWEYQAAQVALKNGEVVGANILKTATSNASSAGTGLSTVSNSAKVATAVDVGTYTADGAEYAALKGVGTTATGTATASTSTLGSFVFGEVLPFIGAVSTGAQIGLAIDEAIYNSHPDWWHYNVQNWDNILLGHDTMLPILHDTNTGTTYITEDAFNQYMVVANNLGVFVPAGEWTLPENPTEFEEAGTTFPCLSSYAVVGPGTVLTQRIENNGVYSYVEKHTIHGTGLVVSQDSSNTWFVYILSDSSTGVAWEEDIATYTGGLPEHGGTLIRTTHTDHDYSPTVFRRINNKSVYHNSGILTITNDPTGSTPKYGDCPKPAPYGYPTGNPLENTAWFAVYGNPEESVAQTAVPGINIAPGAIVPANPTAGVASNYPDLWNNKVTTTGMGTDGRNKTINWVPVPMPSAVGDEDALQSIIDKVVNGELDSIDDDAAIPIGTGDLTQTDDGSYEDEDAEEDAKAVLIPEALLDLINAVKEQTSGKIKIPTGIDIDVPTPPGTDNGGTGDTDTPVLPTGNISNGLAMVYNPVRSELVAFSQYLWSTNFIDLIPKLFQDPMDAIIGLHEIYVTPSVGGRANIVCGYLDSGVESNYVDERYVEIDCGTVDISENFGSVFDYMYTDIEVFLPFIGFVKLDVAQVMRSKLNIQYTVDVLNGACNARIYVIRDSYTVHSYSFDGCCAAALPYSAGTNTMIFQIVAGAVAGAVGGVGGAVTGAVKGALSGGINVHKSGTFNPNAASMDDKVPFVILQRNIDDTPTQFNQWQGYPLHQTAILGGCKGYTIATNIHYSGPATADEVAELEDLLSKGVIL